MGSRSPIPAQTYSQAYRNFISRRPVVSSHHSNSPASRIAPLALAAALALALTASATPLPAPPPTLKVHQSVATKPTRAQQLAKPTLDQRIGQVAMGGILATGPTSTDLSIITRYHLGNIFLAGRSSKGVASIRAITNRLQATVSSKTTGGLRLNIVTDQEGGYVQVLSGPGFSTIPTALHQGGWTTPGRCRSAPSGGADSCWPPGST